MRCLIEGQEVEISNLSGPKAVEGVTPRSDERREPGWRGGAKGDCIPARVGNQPITVPLLVSCVRRRERKRVSTVTPIRGRASIQIGER